MSKLNLIIDDIKYLLKDMCLEDQIDVINEIKIKLHDISPFKKEPVDCIIWIKQSEIQANDYNPNKVAPPEMELLKLSIQNDGYTQPVVSWKENDRREVVDGFHRYLVATNDDQVLKRLNGYLPVTTINKERTDKGNRIASTIRHNRARGKHQIESMSDIVVELKKRNWTDKRICKELGMDEDEVLRLCQITGLSELFSNSEFNEAWEAEIFEEDDFKLLEEEDIK